MNVITCNRMSVLARLRSGSFLRVRDGVRYLSAAQPSGLPLDKGTPAPLPSEDKPLSPKVAALVEEIVNLSLLDVADLNKALKKRLNISDQPFMPAGMMMAAVQNAAANGAPSEASKESESDVPQKMTFSVKLTKFDDSKKISLIKEIRTLVPGLNLVQAKKFVETAPVVVKEDMGKSEAEEMKNALEKVGATIEIV
ncbi:hypothetical protein RB195_010876 [Necator americanus]|uniref:Uncharacterized protein n=2 Tax=Necator americanus TaxID=51031 RepID=A0ABR1D122_NECAM|nr:Ribosomal protein L7/L12 domain protein [Necator americanus]ETN86367.1 Ribosomal protein L7/L12 domain protein [Necator americanus]